MAKLTTKQRKALPSSTFALPGGRFPIPDKNHARLAKSGASRALHVGNISASQKATIDRKADAKLKGDKPMMKKDMPMKKLSGDSGEKMKPGIPMMPNMNKTGFESGKMMQKTAMGPAHKLGTGFDNHEKCCG